MTRSFVIANVYSLLLLAALSSRARATGPESAVVADPVPVATQVSSSTNATVEPATNEPQSPLEPVEQEPIELFEVPVSLHPWARFEPGAWRELQITTETFDGDQQVVSRSVTIQKEVLVAVVGQNYVLDQQVSVDVAGKHFTSEPKQLQLALATDGSGEVLKSTRLDDALLPNDLHATLCQVWEITYLEGARTLVDRLYCQPERFPFVLRRESYLQDQLTSSAAVPEQIVTPVAQELPYAVGGEWLRCQCRHVLKRGEKGDTQSVEMVSAEVPGGAVVVWTADTNPEGARVRWSQIKLLSFEATAVPPLTVETAAATRVP